MRNPFLDFRSVPYHKKELPLERIIRFREKVMDRLMEIYFRLAEDEAKHLVWSFERQRVIKTYNTAIEGIRDLQYDHDDIEEFCTLLDSSSKVPYMILGPAGIYISALINRSQEDRIVLGLQDYQRTFHFLGYRLPKGKTLILQGDVGDFIGACLCGGHLVVEGCTGNMCGAGMIRGEISITNKAGERTGEWMRGGEIHVAGSILSTGKPIFGGKIYSGEKLIAPKQKIKVNMI